MQMWGYDTNDNDLCDCGEVSQTMEHLLGCPLLSKPCRPDDLEAFNPHARACLTVAEEDVATREE